MKNGNNLSDPLTLSTDQTRGRGARRDAEPLVMRPDSGGDPGKGPGRGRILLLLGLVILLAGGVGYWWYAREKAAASSAAATPNTVSATGAAKPSTSNAAPTPAGAPSSAEAAQNASLDGALGLALQGISLFSGEKGAELWRLKASFAHLTREGGNIDVDAPVVRYTMGTPGEPDFQNDFMDVKADKGRVTDNQRNISLWDNVDVRRFDEVITGPRMDYDSQTRIMVFPQGAALDGPKASGEAGVLTWDLGSNTLVAENNVTVVIKPVPDEPEPVAPETEAVPKVSGTATPAVQAVPAASAVQKTPTVQKSPSAPAVKASKTPAAKKTTSSAVKKKSTTKSTAQKRTTTSTTKKATTSKKNTSSSKKTTTKTPASKTPSAKSTTQSAPAKR